jgi:hypothetical protein
MTGQVQNKTRRISGTGTDLWRVVLGPLIWAGHFLLVYVGAAILCQKAGRAASLLPVQWATACATVLALAALALLTRTLWRVRARSLTDDDYEFEHNSPEERHRFLSHVALMLCALSAVAVIYTTIPVLLMESCR